jgi:beta-galactosidase
VIYCAAVTSQDLAGPLLEQPGSALGPEERVRLRRDGLELGDRVVPLLAGSLHYYGVEPSAWRTALARLKELGFRLVDTYVPWSVHEVAPGRFDFGAGSPRRDVTRFLRVAEELGLYAIVRPGPHVNAELTLFGIPERVIWEPACQARSPGNKPVLLPMPPLGFPVPSYASRAFFEQARSWLRAVAAELGPLCWPHGPIVLYQVDNEGSFYFRDSVYDQDYHPDAIAEYRQFLRTKYDGLDALREAVSDPHATFEDVDPPRRFSATDAGDLGRHLGWAEFQEHLLAQALSRFRRELAGTGFERLPASHNLPIAEAVTPLDPERLIKNVELLGMDYYYAASPRALDAIRDRTTELAVRSDAREVPAFACEMGAGFPPYFPPLREQDSRFTVLAALAYGLRGFNIYMTVERDRWIGAPIDAHGERRASADFYEQLNAAIVRLRLFSLERVAPVKIVVPRSLRRLRRVLHAFGSLPPAAFEVLGFGAGEACLEQDFGLESSVLLDAERFLGALLAELGASGVPYALVGADSADFAFNRGHWTILVCSSAVEEVLVQRFLRAAEQGHTVSVGPALPTRDHNLRPLPEPVAPIAAPSAVPFLLSGKAPAIRSAIDGARLDLSLPVLSAEPGELALTVFTEARGVARVLFAINPTTSPVEARVHAHGAERAVDALDGETFHAKLGMFELWVPAQSVRMLELQTGAIQGTDHAG